MTKTTWKPGTMLFPVPPVMVTCGTEENTNVLTIAWTGILCTDPAMTYVSIRKERHSYNIIKETGEFVINLTTEELAYATDWCGVRSGRDVDKWKEMKLTPVKAEKLEYAPMIDAVFKYRTLLQWLACVVVSLLNTLAGVTLKTIRHCCES